MGNKNRGIVAEPIPRVGCNSTKWPSSGFQIPIGNEQESPTVSTLSLCKISDILSPVWTSIEFDTRSHRQRVVDSNGCWDAVLIASRIDS